MTRPWPTPCATCGRPVRKSESHCGSPGSGIAVRHLACALGEPKAYQGAAVPRSRRSCEQHGTECNECYAIRFGDRVEHQPECSKNPDGPRDGGVFT